MVSCCLSAAFSASSLRFDLDGSTSSLKRKMSSAIIVASRYAIPSLDQCGYGFRYIHGLSFPKIGSSGGALPPFPHYRDDLWIQVGGLIVILSNLPAVQPSRSETCIGRARRRLHGSARRGRQRPRGRKRAASGQIIAYKRGRAQTLRN